MSSWSHSRCFRMPLPNLPKGIVMKVYTKEPCQDLLQAFFGDLITFVEPESSGRSFKIANSENTV